MAPVYVKGGMWTNVEDEILKAAIAKYGLNQWSRVSSLLTRKNARQCKLRWQEWLDPRIRKLDWGPEEDQQLLNLARLRPNQWSSISLLLNRTANQCIQRYQELLTDHNILASASQETSNNLNIDSLLLQGNIESQQGYTTSTFSGLNLNPESKPARPDLEEMDEDEREMISEAKARLANTQGKKAKRKAREKILEESKRVADLLRRRELKQVGLNAPLKIKKKFKDQMDYSADIAFERRAEKGKFDTDDEIKLNKRIKMMFDKNTKVKGTLNQEVEAQKRKEKKRREQNKRLDPGSELKRERFEDHDDDTIKYADEFSKRRKLTFDNIPDDNIDIDTIIGRTVQDIKDSNSGISLVFSRKYGDDEDNNKELQPEINKENLKEQQKIGKQKKKEQSKKVHKVLKNLPAAQDDFEIDIDGLMDIENSAINNKPKKGHLIIDKTEQRRNERKLFGELSTQLLDLQTPESIKRDLPQIHHIPSTSPNSEIDSEMIKLIQGNYRSNINNIEDLEKTISLWKEVKTKIDEEVQSNKDNKYDEVFRESESCKLNNNQLIRLIKQYTESSNEIEQNIKNIFNQQKHEYQITKLSKEIELKQNELVRLDNEIWAYQRFGEIELESIKVRKERLQKELDYVNLLIEEKKHNILEILN